MLEIVVEWNDGRKEVVDEAQSEVEARQLVRYYRGQYRNSAKSVWHQSPRRRR